MKKHIVIMALLSIGVPVFAQLNSMRLLQAVLRNQTALSVQNNNEVTKRCTLTKLTRNAKINEIKDKIDSCSNMKNIIKWENRSLRAGIAATYLTYFSCCAGIGLISESSMQCFFGAAAATYCAGRVITPITVKLDDNRFKLAELQASIDIAYEDMNRIASLEDVD